MASQRSAARILVNVLLDGALAALAAVLARWIADPKGGLLHPLWFLGGGGITLLLGGLPFRLSQQYWRFSGMSDLIGVAGGSIASAVLFAGVWLATGFPLPTATFPIVHAMTLAVLLGAPRLGYRLYQARPRVAADDPALERIILVGAGNAADGFIRALSGQRQSVLRVTGLLAMTDRHTGHRMHGMPILGTVAEAAAVLERLARQDKLPRALVITEPDFLGAKLAALIETAEQAGVSVRRAPRPTALTDAERIELKPVAIEDLLNRPEVVLDRDGMARLVAGRRVVVTGAGGSIGSELARQLAALRPSKLVLLDNNEYALWQIDLEMSEHFADLPRRAVIADVRDALRIREVFSETKPALVFHAAALKHVPMVEANRLEGLLTNACGTRVVADAARAAGAAATVLISTDKAVNPTSLMGASKRLAEIYCQALDVAARHAGAGMRCVTVRFGNVLGSTGSVVPLFRRQLERGGPLTVTHPDMQRYFMTVSEAVSLVLQASVVGLSESVPGGEHGGIFVLDMGKPVRILDLARQMIVLAGLRPDRDVQIEFTGLRPGEKLYEELFHGSEPPADIGHPGLLIATPRASDAAAVGRALDEIAQCCRRGDIGAALAVVDRLVPEFSRDVGVEKESVLS
jgi:O-antigen biosynthesis protein WbqV